MNLGLFIPELTLAITAILILILDVTLKPQKALPWIAAAGLVIAGGYATFTWSGASALLFNRTLAMDNFAYFFKLFFTGAAFLVVLASKDYSVKFEQFRGEYYALVLLSTLGMMLMASATDLISIYISLELTSISLYALVGFLKDSRSTEASLKYLLLGAIASAVLLYGMALIFGFTGKTQLNEIAAVLRSAGTPTLMSSPAVLLGIVLLITGFGFKIASVPSQMWVPDVYEGAPTPITAFLSVGSKAAGFALIMRVFFTAFSVTWLNLNWGIIFAVLAALSMTFGNIVAIPQANIKRLFGYSSIAQAGYLMVGLATIGFSAANDIAGRSSTIFFLASYAFTNLGAFIAIIAISNKLNSDTISDYSGLGKRAPLLALALTLCLISLIGVPPASGFIAKFFIFRAAVSHGLFWLVIIAVINSVISAYYYLRVVKVMWFGEAGSTEAVPSGYSLKIALAITCAGVVFLGVLPDSIMRLAEFAARMVAG